MSTDDARNVFEKALDAASDAFHASIDAHFGRTFDGSPEDLERLSAEYEESSRLLRNGQVLHLRTGLIDADFACWHSSLADQNFGEDSAR